MSAVKNAYQLQAQTVIKNMKKRGINGYYAADKEEALKTALSLMEKGSSVAAGGSATLTEIGLLDYVKTHPDEYTFIDRKAAKTPLEAREIHAKTMMADYFLMSSNAITKEGELVNIDGNGNRVGALCFGPDKVIIVAGMNKITSDLHAAYKRIRTQACPPNCMRLNLKTPCAATGFCGDCLGSQSICSQFLTIRQSRFEDRIHVILVGENLGF